MLSLEYTDETLFIGDNPLINLSIEDPIPRRISLYLNYKVIEEINYLMYVLPNQLYYHWDQ